MAAVADPAGGAHAVERLTDDLCKAAWAELVRIETEGEAAFDERVARVRNAARLTSPSGAERSPG